MGEVKVKLNEVVEEGEKLVKKEVERTLKDEDVQKIVSGRDEMAERLTAITGESAKLKVVKDFMTKFNLDPETLVANADGAFSLVNQLIEDGVIDTSGKVLVRKGEPEKKVPKGDEGKDDDSTLGDILKGLSDTKGLKGEDKIAAIVAKAIAADPTLRTAMKGIEEVTMVQTNMLRSQWENKFIGAYPNLTTDDVRRVFSEAAQRPKEGLMEIAKGVSEAKSKVEGELRKKIAAEFGVNLEEFDANKLKEKGSAGGAAVMFQGKGFTLSKRRENKDRIDPEKATREYLRKQGILR